MDITTTPIIDITFCCNIALTMTKTTSIFLRETIETIDSRYEDPFKILSIDRLLYA